MGLTARKNNEDTTRPKKADDASKALKIVFFTVLLDLVGFGIIIPIQPFLAENLGAAPTVVTILGASFSLMQFLFAPVWGRLSDRVGRRPIMLISIATTVVGYTIFGFARELSILFVARMLAGLGSANLGTAQAIIADSTEPEKRAKGMGLIGAAFGLGFIFGPLIGGLLVRFGLSAPAFAAAGLCALNFVFAALYLPETRPKESMAKAGPAGHSFSIGALKHAARHPGVSRIFFLYLVYTSAFSLMEQVLGLFIENRWLGHVSDKLARGTSAADMTTKVLVVVGITATIVQGGLIGKLTKKFGEHLLLVLGFCVVAGTLFLIPTTGSGQRYGLLLVTCGLMAVGTGLVNPSLSSLLSRSVNKDEQGGVLGLGQGLAALGRVCGPMVAGLLFENSANLPFLTGGFLVLLCVVTAMSLRPLGHSFSNR